METSQTQLEFFLDKLVILTLKSGAYIKGDLVGWDEDFIFIQNLEKDVRGFSRSEISCISLDKKKEE